MVKNEEQIKRDAHNEEMRMYRRRMYEKCIADEFPKYCTGGVNVSSDYLAGKERYEKRVKRYRKKYLKR